jgi:hypothetical protein
MIRSVTMAKKTLTICEICGGTSPSAAADFLVFHCLTFCSPECLDDYRATDEERRARKDAGRGESVKTLRARSA